MVASAWKAPVLTVTLITLATVHIRPIEAKGNALYTQFNIFKFFLRMSGMLLVAWV